MSTSEEIVNLHQRYVMPTYAPSVALVKGRGTRVWDADGREYLDFLSGIAVLPLGHCHRRVVSAIRKQCATLVHVSNLYYNENQPRLAEKLSGLSLKGKCFFCNSGAEANEGLIKLARLWGHDSGKYEVVTMRNSFHGRTLATAAATGQAKVQKGFEPMPEGFKLADYNNLDSVRAQITEKTAAVLLEMVQGEGGIVSATPEFARGVRALCDERNILMLCDEVQAGLGRTGHWFAFQGFGVEPDAFSLAKGLGNGFPIGAVVAGPKLSDVFQPGKHASTFGGTPLACAAALATIETIENDGLVENAARMGKFFADGLRKLGRKHAAVTGVRSAGLMVGLVLAAEAKELEMALIAKGLLAVCTAGNVIRFLPPLNIKRGDVKRALAVVDSALAEWTPQAPAQPAAKA